MKKVALKIAYIGTNFHGFQRQPNHRTVEGELIYTLKKLGYIDDLSSSKFGIAGRTDRGVHSLGNVISFMSDREVIVNQINHKLPEDIQIIAKAPVRYGFKPRYAESKHYRYVFFEENLNISRMNELASLFEGKHDFTNFSKRNNSQKTTVRTINKIEIMNNNTNINTNNADINNNINSNYNNTTNTTNTTNNNINNLDIDTESLDTYNFDKEYSQKLENPNYLKNSPKYISDLKESGDFIESHYIGELKAIGRFNENFQNVNFNKSSYEPVFIDIYGESFLWNMIRKMMRIFLFVGKEEMEVEEVKDMLDPTKEYNIKPLNPENLILMDIDYNNIKFQYDDYALEGFKRVLVRNLFDYKMKISLENSLLNSLESLK
ncbi:tRNA pseudouridine synthase [Methanobrevibacter arboriphilus JCM 13429 = DSM 1125]|uniref:tRNA pseudouridine synthase A n=1 Tax=Methanobrevibacter arboriphilus JCM 13429 = DSM 1125 TaxID=1300164 RepID=A0A1V6N1K5_METAZ|nr:tRNA pseudouridine(38-40) synthase TruA [Methanobrevibacter arboriphilus]OQD58497.1 tRNA pseudouridine synthase [Methanobrevibacter arboriphilus JCM 13429 = DSM 1125]